MSDGIAHFIDYSGIGGRIGGCNPFETETSLFYAEFIQEFRQQRGSPHGFDVSGNIMAIPWKTAAHQDTVGAAGKGL